MRPAAAAARRQLRPARCQTSALDAIYSIGVDGAGLTRLTHSPCHDTLSARRRVRRRRQPSRLLPDGIRFAFLRKQRRTGPYPSRDKAAALSAANTSGTGSLTQEPSPAVPGVRPPAGEVRLPESARGDHDGDHAGADVRADHRADLADRDLAAGQVRREPAARCSASTPARSGLARWATATSTWRSLAAATASSSRRLSARADVRTFSSVRDPAVHDLQQRLDRQRRPEQRGGGADPAAATEVLQRVDVEQRRGRRRPAASAAPAASSQRPAASSTSAAASTANPVRHAELPGVDGADRERRVARGQLGGLEGAAHLRRQVHRERLLGARRRAACS